MRRFILSLLIFPLSSHPATLRSFGARGDGKTDDRSALQAALTQSAGQPLDGEGLTYAVDGNVSVSVDVDLSNATLKQLAGSFDTTPYIRSTVVKEAPKVRPVEALTRMVDGLPLLRFDGVATYPDDPVLTGDDRDALRRMLNLRTLFIQGAQDHPVSVKLDKVKVLRGDHPDSGMHSNAAGLYIVNACPLVLTQVEVSGAGKGAGMFVTGCKQVRMDHVHIHDILWAPYKGDVEFSAAVLGSADFGWNNSPIYDYDEREGRFVRVRVQEQTVGLVLTYSEDVEIKNSRVERIGTTVDGKFLPWQADALTVGGVKNLTMRDCEIREAWEGIDFTGKGVDGFLQENIRISDCFSYSFKYAHPQKNGKVIGCLSERAAYKGFTIGSECENIEFTRCVALETGSAGYWVRPGRKYNGIAGFDVHFDEGHSPHKITLQDCRAENVKFPTSMEFGFLTSDRARKPEHEIKLVNPESIGATVRAVDGFAQP